MSMIIQKFDDLKKQNRTALAPYFMAGYPSLDASFELIRTAVESGADMIELGMPFSDPLADGPTIQRAAQKALTDPFGLDDLLRQCRSLTGQIKVPVVVMTYFNLIYQVGVEKTAELAKENGIAGFIVPDLTLEEADGFRQACRQSQVDWVPLVAPTSNEDRIRLLDQAATGMLYYVSRVGVTGARAELPESLLDDLDRYRQMITHPSVVGFGISTAEQAGLLKDHVDGIVIASAIIRSLENSPEEDYQQIVSDFLKPISQALAGGGILQ